LGVAFVGGALIRDQYPQRVGNEALVLAVEAFKAELAGLSAAAHSASRNETVIEAARNSDEELARAALSAISEEKGIWGMSVTDRNGIVLTRTTAPGVIGDNAFFTRAHGRALVEGEVAPASLERSSLDSSIIVLSAGHLVHDADERIGAFFATQLPDDEYARYFRDTYLPKGAEIAFYSLGDGIVSASIDDERARAILKASLPGNQDILDADGTRLFRSMYGQIFTIAVYAAPGIDGSVGGFIVLAPVPGAMLALIGGFFVIPLFLFVVVALKLHQRARSEQRYLFYYVALAVVALVLAGVAALAYGRLLESIPMRTKMPYPLYNSSLRLQPEGGVFSLNRDQQVQVVLDTGEEEINALSVSLSYDPAQIEIGRIDLSDSPCEFILERAIDRTKGELRIACTTAVTPAAAGQVRVASFFVKGKKGGPARIAFGEDTQVLANDGLGTDVLRIARGATFTFEEEASATSTPHFTLYSPSHSNAERWYRDRTLRLLWTDGRGPYHVVVTKEGSPTPVIDQLLLTASASLPLGSDGTFAVSVESADGEHASLIARADSTPPRNVELLASDESVRRGDLVRFRMNAKDEESGLQRASYLKIDDGLFFPVGQEVYVPFYEEGTRQVTYRAFDKAGNRTDVTKEIRVRSGFLGGPFW
jgi:hypothetical protein